MKQIIITLTILTVVVFSVWLLKEQRRANRKMGTFELKNQKTLFEAIKANDVNKVRELAPITDLNTKNNRNHSLLYAAVDKVTSRFFWEEKLRADTKINPKSAEIIKILLENGADPLLDEGKYKYESVISTATTEHTPDQVLDAMLAGGLDPNILIGSWQTPLICELLTEKKFSKLKLLIENYSPRLNYFRLPEGEGRSHIPVLIAARNGSPEIVRYLIEHGANPKEIDLAYQVFTNIAGKAKRIDDLSSKDSDEYQDLEQELIENLNLKEFLIQKGVSWPPKASEKVKKKDDWASSYLEDIALEKKTAKKYANHLTRIQ